MLIASHFEFLKRQTVDRLYENYRTEIVCLTAPAPEAPMRVAKSGDHLHQSMVRDTAETEHTGQAAGTPHHEVHAQEEFVDAIDEQLAVYQATSLDPIREEDESTQAAELAANAEDGKGRRGKKRSSHGKLKGSRSVEELKEPLESPLPAMQ
jgi:septin family protein